MHQCLEYYFPFKMVPDMCKFLDNFRSYSHFPKLMIKKCREFGKKLRQNGEKNYDVKELSGRNMLTKE